MSENDPRPEFRRGQRGESEASDGQPAEEGGERMRLERRHGGDTAEDWARIETERDARTRAARDWEATHGPSDEFEQAARPLGRDYGTDRPRERSEAELLRAANELGLTVDHVRRLRERMFTEIDERGAGYRPYIAPPPDTVPDEWTAQPGDDNDADG